MTRAIGWWPRFFPVATALLRKAGPGNLRLVRHRQGGLAASHRLPDRGWPRHRHAWSARHRRGDPDELAALVAQLWPETWAEAVSFGAGARRHAWRAHRQYRPERLALGSLAILGDAAHVLSPMTGSGYATGVEDAALLAKMLAQRNGSEPLSALLKRYEGARLPYTRALVNHSRNLSAEFRQYAAGF